MPRRKKQYTVIVRKGSPFWQYRLEGWTGYKPTPVLITYRSGEPRNKTEAEAWALEEWKRQGGAPKPLHGKSLREFLVPYFVPGICPHMTRILSDSGRYSTRWAKDQRKRIDTYILADRIADIELDALKPGDFEDLKLRLRTKPISARTINIILGALKTAIREGYHRGDLHQDPTAGVGKIRETPEETGIFSVEEMRLIVSSKDIFKSSDHNHGNVKGKTPDDLARVFFVLCATTGERPEAILGIRWGDLSGDILTLSRTKTTEGRSVPILPAVQELLEDLRFVGLHSVDDAYVFAYDDKSRCLKSWYRGRFYRMMKTAHFSANDSEGRRRRPYSLKHSLITHLIDAGSDEVLVREFVGHSHGYGSSRILTRVQATYKHRQAERLRELVPAIKALYYG